MKTNSVRYKEGDEQMKKKHIVVKMSLTSKEKGNKINKSDNSKEEYQCVKRRESRKERELVSRTEKSWKVKYSYQE